MHSPIQAQQKLGKDLLDSLAYIADTSVGKSKVDALRSLEYNIRIIGDYGYDEIQISTEALAIAKKTGYTEGEARLYTRLAFLINHSGSFLTALEYCRRSIFLSSFLDKGLDSNILMGAYKQMSISYRGLEMYDSAYYFGQKSLEMAQRIGTCPNIAALQLEMARYYSQIGNHEAEVNAYLEGYEIVKNCPDTIYRSSYGTYAKVLGYFYMTQGNYKEALKYFCEADSLYGNMDLLTTKEKLYHAGQASNIARVYQHWGMLDSAMRYRQLALDRYFDYGFSEYNINVPNQYCYMGSIHREQGDFILAREYIEKSLALRKSNGDSLGVGMSLDELAILAKLKGQYQLAVQQLQESLQWKKCFKDARVDPNRRAQGIESQSETYLILGQLFADWNKIDDALLYYDTAFMLNAMVGYKRGEAQVEYYRGIAWQKIGEQDTAYKYINNSLKLAEEIQNRPLIAKAMAGHASLFEMQGKLSEAEEYYKFSLNIYLEDGFTRELPEIYLKLGQINTKLVENSLALDMLQKSYTEASSMGMIKIQAESAFELAGIYDRKGDFRLSNNYLREYILLNDSVFTLATHRQLSEMQAFHEYQRQQMQILQLEQENEIGLLRVDRSRYIIISLGGILIIILLFAVLFIRQMNIRSQQIALINQQKLFRSQMNPHFIFNSLTNIQHFIFSKDSLAAGKYLAVFAKLMRSILNNSRKELISLKDEIATINQYLELQQLRMEDKLVYEIEVDEAINQELTNIPPMLAQPFIENSVEHGIRNMEQGGKVLIRIKKEEGYLLYEVEDNGIGRQKASELQIEKSKDHESMAVSLTRSRLLNLWRRNRIRKVLEIIDLQDEAGNPLGTLIRFKVPL